jgi:hypothetical protein
MHSTKNYKIGQKAQKKLLDFSFFVDNVLTDGWIILFDLHLVRRVTLIFISSIKVSCTSAGH